MVPSYTLTETIGDLLLGLAALSGMAWLAMVAVCTPSGLHGRWLGLIVLAAVLGIAGAVLCA